MPIREIKFPFAFEKKYLFFKTIRSDYEDDDGNIFTALEDDMA